MPCIRIVADVSSVIDERLVWNVSIEHDAGKLRQVKLRDPFSVAQERECKWYLERYTRSPFAVERATTAEGSLREYGRSLFVQLRLAEFRQLWSADTSEIDIEVVQRPQSTNDESGSPSIHRLHWELLEEVTLWSLDSARISIRRHLAQKGTDKSAGTSGEKSPRENNPRQGATFNVLLVVARDLTLDGAAYEDVDASCALRALLSIRNALADSTSSPTLSIEVVRPGTLPALKEHLNRYIDGHFDIDMHGNVRKLGGVHTAYLMFADAASATDLCPIRADTMGKMLSAKGVHLAVLNSCNSARSDHGMPANIASNFITHGVTHVLAMSYEFMASAAPLFLNSFYRSFFLQGLPFSRAVAFSRYVLKRQSRWNASFGLTVDLQDWSVPTVYTNGLDARFSYEAAGKPMSKALDGLSSADIELWTYDNVSLTGRDLDKLRFERELVENRAVYMYGPAAIGKSAILEDLTREWRETGFAEVLYVDFAQVPHITLDVIVENMYSGLSSRSIQDAPSERSPALLLQMSRLKRTVLIFDSLDTPYSYMIQEWRKDKNLEEYHRDYASVHKFILSIAELALNRPEPTFNLILIGRKGRSWIQEQLPGLDVSAFELPALSLPAAISLGERILTAHGVQPEALRRSDSLVHIVQMLQKLPGALKLVLPKASKDTSLESFRQALLHGDVTLTVTDVKAEPLPSNRFLRVLDTLDDVQLQYPLAPFWGEGPIDLERFFKQLRELGLDYGDKWLTIFFSLNDLNACFVSKTYVVSWIHPLWTLLLRGKQQSSFAWKWRHSDSLQPLRTWLDKGQDYFLPGSSWRNSERLLKIRELFCTNVQERFNTFFLIQHLGANNFPEYGRYYRGSLSNVLSILDICCDEAEILPLTKWPMELFTWLTAMSRLYLSVPEQTLFNQALERALKVFIQRNGGFAVETALLMFPLVAATHLRTFYGPDKVKAHYRPEYTDVALAIIEASETRCGTMPRHEMMHKGLAFRYKAIDMLIAKDEEEADVWWEKMNEVDRILYPAQADTKLDELDQAPMSNSGEVQVPQTAQDRFSRENDARLRSWLVLRGPSFWKWMKSAILRKDLEEQDLGPLHEMTTNLRQAFDVYEQTGVTGLERWESCFPMQIDMVRYLSRFEDPSRRLFELEQAIETGNWEEAFRHHMEIYNSELARGHVQAAKKHYDEAREIYVKNVDDMGGLGLRMFMAEHEVPLVEHGLQQIQQVQAQMARDVEQKHQRIEEMIMAGKPIDWNVLTELSESSIEWSFLSVLRLAKA